MNRLLIALLWLALTAYSIEAATTVRSSSANTGASGTAVSITAPTGTTTGDLEVCIVSSNGTVTHVDNNGGTPFSENLPDFQGSGSGTLSVWTRRIVGGDPGTYNWTLGADNRWTVECVTFQSPNVSGVFDGSISTNADGAGTLTTGTANGMNTSQPNSFHVVVLTTDGPSNTITATPAGYTCQQNGGDQTTAVCTKVIASPSATGAQSFSWSSISEYMSASFAILDEGAASVIRIYGDPLFRIY